MTISAETIEHMWVVNGPKVGEAAKAILSASRVYCVGNGGSALTMSHMAADLCRLGIDAESLTDNVSRLTALTNDEGWGKVYREMLRGRNLKGAVLVVASVNGSSGRSESGETWSANLYDAAVYFREAGGRVVSLVGNGGGELKNVSDVSVYIKSRNPYVVEGVHSVICHIICDKIREMKL